MENNYTYSSSHPGSGDSSPRSREVECETAVAVTATAAWDEAPPLPHAAVAAAASARVKLMCSYGGRIIPRSHDNQLSYAGGDTKILAVDRSIRYPSILARLNALSSSALSDDVIIKYQLPGEDLDALISVTNDEDLEHMMIEYDRLHRTGSKPLPRLRLFLFPVMGKGSQDRASFADSPPAVTTPKEGPDYLFGLEAAATTTTTNFLQPEAEVKEPAVEMAGIEVAPPPARSVEAEEVVPTQAELQMHVQELQRLQITEKQQQQRNGSDETVLRAYPAEYYVPPPPAHDKAPPAPAMAPVTAPPPAYWQDSHRSVAPAPGPRFASFMGGDGNLYLIPTNPGVYPASAAPGQTYYTTVQRMVPAGTYDNSPAVYGTAPPQQAKAPAAAYDNGGVRAQQQQQQAVEVSAAGYGGVAPPPAGAYDNGAGYAAYDNAGRPVYYAGPGATYQTVNNVAIAAESKVLKPSQVS